MDDNIQHGIDDDPNNDPHKAKNIGGVGGAVTGAIAGVPAGPLGVVGGAIVGGVVGAVASKAAVKEIDKHDNDNTITGIGHGATRDVDTTYDSRDVDATYGESTPQYNDNVPGYNDRGNGIPGIQTGGHAADGSPDTRGITEKIADKLTGDRIDDKTGKPTV